jgi:hypothetical protein
MELIAKGLAAGLLVWFFLLAALIGVRILRGDIEVTGFLAHSAGAAGKAMEPERVVVMTAFPLVILMYTMSALHADLTPINGRPTMPDVPEYLLTILTGGNGLYLAGKMFRRT